MASPRNPVPGVARFPIGSRTLTVINDGGFDASFDYVTHLGSGEARTTQLASLRPEPPKISLHAMLIEGGPGGPIVVDSGYGAEKGPTLGQFAAGLKALGVDPSEVATVLLTHLHPDHVGGLVDGGKAVFPKAEIVVPEGEAAYWLAPGALEKAPDGAKDYFKAAQAGVAPYRDRMRTVSSGEVLPGITAVPLPGHTPGHTGYRLDDGGRSLLIWGDIVHLPGIQFARPEAGMAFDSDGDLAAKTRKDILERVAADKTTVTGMHLEFPAVGHVVKEGAGYRFVPELWVPTGG